MPQDDLAAREWLAKWLERQGIQWDNLTAAQQFLAAREIPCSIRCWRVGGPVDVKPGDVCPECGQEVPKPTCWEMIPLRV